MVSGPLVVVGSQVVDPGVVALLELAARLGLDVPRAAVRPPVHQEDGASGGVPPGWHGLQVPRTRRAWPTRVLDRSRGADILEGDLVAALRADPWLQDQLDREPTARVVALDGAAGRALDALARRGRPTPLPRTDWATAAVELAGQLADQPEPARPSVRRARSEPDPGAMHRVVVATPDGASPRDEVVSIVPTLRSRLTVLGPGEEVPTDTDVLVLDGLGPVVARLDRLGEEVRVVHLPRPGDEVGPWRILLGGRATVPRRPLVVAPLAEGGGLPAAAGLRPLLLGPDTDRLVQLGREHQDEEALRLVRELLDGGAVEDPLLRREMTYLTRVTGSLTLERRVLRTTAATGVHGPRLSAALRRVEDRLLETDPAWVPDLPPVDLDPVPGRVLHLLKTTLPQRQAGYSVRGHHTLVALRQAGVDVVAASLPVAGGGDDGPGLLQEHRLDGVRYLVPPPTASTGGPAQLAEAARTLLDVVVAERPSVLHVHSGHRGYDLGVVGAAVARAAGLPWVYEMRGLFESTWSQDEVRAERGELFTRRGAREAVLAAEADAVVTLSETMRADLAVRGVPEGDVHVVPNAVDPTALRPHPRDEDLARRLGVEGRLVIGYISNLDHAREQVEDLVRAAVLLRDQGREVGALVVGTGRREEQLRRLATDLGADDVVIFTGAVPHADVGRYYGLLDLLVVPRSSERAARLVTPLKPYEAMAMGVPVLVSAQPALLEVIGDGERGWSYPAGDPGGLAAVVARLMDDPDLRHDVAARARRWVVAERTWGHNAARYAEIYRRLAERAR
ncbi:glycosyltransferase [Ornithinimicrobium sp. W1665]|uniref:glycosyltransferase n=1 Tax=Ornithinimicrobium sp. W1665 TaxID=3416666 RepID=UPI003CF7ED7B